MLSSVLKVAAVIVLTLPLAGCLSLSIGDNSSERTHRQSECRRCGQDLPDRLCGDCQEDLWKADCAECAKLGAGKMCGSCQEKAAR